MSRLHRVVFIEEPADFPNPRAALGDFPAGLGRILTPDLMLAGYRLGYFAWSDNPVSWWTPAPRAVMELDGFHVSRSLARTLKSGRFEVTTDVAFDEVVRGCAGPRAGEDGTWISDRFAACFAELHRRGFAHSVECWDDGRLAGGVFGVAIGGYFSAESMFHYVTDASKVALHALVERLRAGGFALLDIQVLSDHTASLGAVEISRDEYLDRLATALERTPVWATPAR
jgi:leucyl/phenylalanyl-tRNA--protein transferase